MANLDADADADVLVVGAGHAGAGVAIGLAKLPGAPRIVLVGEEAASPYERPPLTKRLLYDTSDPVPVPLRSQDYWSRSPVQVRTGVAVEHVDAERHVVHTGDGEALSYGTLVWATGGRAARSGLPGEELAGVHSLRGFGDLLRLREDVAVAASAVVVGGGYVGLEVASALRRRGIAVSIVEIAPRLLSRVTGPQMSAFLTELHRSEGVDVRLGVGVSRLQGVGGRVRAVELDDGTTLPADVVVIGVGMRPVVRPLLEAGARGDAGGVDVDAECATSLPDVYAAGDCARQVSPWSASPLGIRIESVHSAGTHAAAVVRALAGLPAQAPPPPRFWSTQYGRELRSVGLRAPSDVEVVRGEKGASFTVAYLREGTLVALETVDHPRDFARAQALIAQRWRPGDVERLADPSVELPRRTGVEVGVR